MRRLGSELCDRNPAAADPQVDRRVDLAEIELHQDVIAGDAELGRAERDEGCDVERPHADQRHPGYIGRKLERTTAFVAKGLFGNDSCPFEDRQRFLQDATLRQRDDQLVGHAAAVPARPLRGKGGAATGGA